MRKIISFVALLLQLTLVASGQAAPNGPPTLAQETAKLKSGDFDSSDVDFFVHHAPRDQAIAVLEAQFGPTKDDQIKAHIASVLMRLGDKGSIYWDFLVERATAAINSDAPPVISLDPQDKAAKPGISPAFTAWAKSHNLSVEHAAEDAMYWTPGFVLLLAVTEDPRAIPLLRQALWSQNFMIQMAGAQGLALLQDKDSIRPIIAACQRSPSVAGAFAFDSLIYFDDPEAQRAVDTYLTYLPKDTVDQLRQSIHDNKLRPFGETP